MNLTIQQAGIQTVAAEAIIINLFQGVTSPGGATGVVDKALGGAISDLIESGDLRGKAGETAVLYPRGAIPARRVIVVGLGKQDEFGPEAVREAAAVAIKQTKKLGATSIASIIHGGGIGGLEIGEAAQAVVEGSLLALYKYDAPRSKKKAADEEQAIESLTLVEFDETKIAAVEAGARAGQIIADSVYLARDLVNRPGNVLTPTALAEAARAMCTEVGLTCRVLEEADMAAQQMNALLAVSKGSAEPAKFIVMEHLPHSDAQPIVLIGKGVTYDTGGYWIKPNPSQDGMHTDMAGAAAVIGAMRAVKLLDLPLNVIGLVPSAENMISDKAYKSNDVYIAKNGVSIEIISTDAEGRLLLADALCYAADLNPAVVIDVATLTGGKIVALGQRLSALFSNDDALAEALFAAGRRVNEPMWRMPLDPGFDRQLKSEIADVKNSGGREGHAIVGARFLSNFVGEWAWAHLDIAGDETYSGGKTQTPRSYMTKGATGTPLRALVECLRRWG
ncbi:MAG TPA: leucyl aminopeptidase [Anaerolineae bacterium]